MAEVQVNITRTVTQTETKKTKNMTALSNEIANIRSVPSINANPRIVKRRLYNTNDINSTTGKVESPTKMAMNMVTMGYSMTKANTDARMEPTLEVYFHVWEMCKLESPRLLISCDIFPYLKEMKVMLTTYLLKGYRMATRKGYVSKKYQPISLKKLGI